MVTPPLEERQVRGRGASNIRTPTLIRDYLSGQGEFPEDTPEERAARPQRGDYIARMHRRIKLHIQEAAPGYQFPRRHPFGSLVDKLKRLGLLEETGEREEPAERGAGVLGTARGFQQRVYVRMAPGALDRREWADPVGFMALIYPGLRPVERPLPPVPPLAEPTVPPPAVPPSPVQALDQQRRAIMTQARQLAETGNTVEEFQALLRRAQAFVRDAAAALPPQPFPAAPEALDLLRSCIRILEAEPDLTPRRVTAVINCQASSRLLADALAPSLVALAARAPAAELPDFELPPTPTGRNVAALARHLQVLERLGTGRGDVRGRLEELAEDLLDWTRQVEEAIEAEEAREEPSAPRLTDLHRALQALLDASQFLATRQVRAAMEALVEGFREAEPVPAAPPVERPPVPSIVLPTRFTSRSVPRLLDHFQQLMDLAQVHQWPDEEWPEMDTWLERLQEAAGDWRDAAQEALDNEEARDVPREARVEELQERVDRFDRYIEALEGQDLEDAVAVLEELG